MSTTQNTSTQYSLDTLADLAGSYAAAFHADFDLENVAAQWLAEINEQLPEGATLTASGVLYFSDDVDYDALNLAEIVDSVDLSALLQAHEAVIATIKQSAEDWNYATINISDEEVCWLESSAHTFHEVEGVSELANFDGDQWQADIDAALSDAGYTRVGELQRAGDFVQTCKAVPA